MLGGRGLQQAGMDGSLGLSPRGMVMCPPPMKQALNCLKTRGQPCLLGEPLPTGITFTQREYLCPQGGSPPRGSTST